MEDDFSAGRIVSFHAEVKRPATIRVVRGGLTR
jgi:hypothetical protein